MEEFLIDINPEGNVQIEGKGFVGTECTELTRELERAIGKVAERTFKSEYHRPRSVLRKQGA